jgi:hypothetical protein
MVWAVAETGSTRNAWLDHKFLGTGWDDENLTNGLKKVQISCPVNCSCRAEQRGVVTGKTAHNGTIGGTDSERYHKVPHDFLQNTVDSIPGRVRKLADTAGAYTES